MSIFTAQDCYYYLFFQRKLLTISKWYLLSRFTSNIWFSFWPVKPRKRKHLKKFFLLNCHYPSHSLKNVLFTCEVEGDRRALEEYLRFWANAALEWRRMGKPIGVPGVLPGELAEEPKTPESRLWPKVENRFSKIWTLTGLKIVEWLPGAVKTLSERRLWPNAEETRR